MASTHTLTNRTTAKPADGFDSESYADFEASRHCSLFITTP